MGANESPGTAGTVFLDAGVDRSPVPAGGRYLLPGGYSFHRCLHAEAPGETVVVVVDEILRPAILQFPIGVASQQFREIHVRGVQVNTLAYGRLNRYADHRGRTLVNLATRLVSCVIAQRVCFAIVSVKFAGFTPVVVRTEDILEQHKAFFVRHDTLGVVGVVPEMNFADVICEGGWLVLFQSLTNVTHRLT